MAYIDIDKKAIPYRFNIDIAGEEFTFEVNYNQRFDYFTINLYKNGDLVVLCEKITYGRALFSSCPNDNETPKYPIVPYDEAGQATRVGWDELGEKVFLWLGDTNA